MVKALLVEAWQRLRRGAYVRSMSSDDPKPVPMPGKHVDKGPKPSADKPVEIGGPKGPEPTRYGDWEQNGRCTDF